jgi:hypothetical protein
MNPLLSNPIFLGLIKFFMVVLGIIYLLYAVILLRQIQMMNETVKTSVAGTVFLMGVVHLGLAILVGLYLLVM